MVLQGLDVPVWSGWLSGMLFFQYPWGTPKHRSYFDPIFLYHGALTIFSIVLWIDYVVSYSETFGGDLWIRQVITKAFTYMAIVVSTYLRICYGIQVKKSALFFQRLELHPIFTSSSGVEPVIDRLDKIILMSALFLKILAGFAFAAAVAVQRKPQNSLFAGLGSLEYSIVFFLFATLPLAVSIHIAFSFTVVITKYLIFIFEEFCNYFERTITFGSNENMSEQMADPLPPMLPEHSTFVFQAKGDMLVINYKKQMRENLLKQFDSVTELFQMYDEVTGPYLLGLVIVTIMFFVQTINAILIFDLSPLFLAFDWFTLICLVAQLVLILFNLGHYAHRTIAHRKIRLRRLVGGMANSFEKEQLVETTELVSCFEWSMSAWGFFVIDRSLMPGVLSIMMSYVVILFQLQFSSNNQCNCVICNSTIATTAHIHGQ